MADEKSLTNTDTLAHGCQKILIEDFPIIDLTDMPFEIAIRWVSAILQAKEFTVWIEPGFARMVRVVAWPLLK